MRFYDSYIKAIDGVNSAQDAMTLLEGMTSIVINAFTLDGVGLKSDFYTAIEEVFNQLNNHSAETIGKSFLDYGYVALREYALKKDMYQAKYIDGWTFATDQNLTASNLSDLSQLYILQQRATLFLQYGMQVYQSTTNTDEKTFGEYLMERIASISLAFFPDSGLKTTAGYLNMINSHGKKLEDVIKDSSDIIEIRNAYKQMWGKLMDVNNYDSFYNEATQSNNINLLKTTSGYTFEEVIEDTTPPTVSFQIGTYNSYDTITSTDPIDVTFSWSEDVTGFYTDDVVVTGATKVVFTKVSDSVYNLQIAPNDNFTGELSVQVILHQVQDNAYNSGVGTLTGSVNVNTMPAPETITHNGITYGTVTSPHTGRVWLDRNLGASQVCTSFDDEACYGDYYQWGRDADGHEKSNSNTTATFADSIKPTHGNFIITYNSQSTDYDWVNSGVDDNGSLRSANWSKTDGSSVCPIAYRVPTGAEILAETIEVEQQNSWDLFLSFLKLPSSGWRNSNGSMYPYGSDGVLWTNSITENEPIYLFFMDSGIGTSADVGLGHGKSLRCIKDISSSAGGGSTGGGGSTSGGGVDGF